MQGLHLTADLSKCAVDCAPMTDPQALREACLAAVRAAGLQPVGELFHRFPSATHSVLPSAVFHASAIAHAQTGVTGVVLLAESHLAVHTWPEIDSVTLDVYVCNFGTDNTARAHALMDALVASFRPARIEQHALARGAA